MKSLRTSNLLQDNVLLDDLGTPRLTDFGLARCVAANSASIGCLDDCYSGRWQAGIAALFTSVYLYEYARASPEVMFNSHPKSGPSDMFAFGMAIVEVIRSSFY